MAREGRGRIFKRKDGKYLIYVPLGVAEDTGFPFKTDSARQIWVSFTPGERKVTIEEPPKTLEVNS